MNVHKAYSQRKHQFQPKLKMIAFSMMKNYTRSHADFLIDDGNGNSFDEKFYQFDHRIWNLKIVVYDGAYVFFDRTELSVCVFDLCIGNVYKLYSNFLF